MNGRCRYNLRPARYSQQSLQNSVHRKGCFFENNCNRALKGFPARELGEGGVCSALNPLPGRSREQWKVQQSMNKKLKIMTRRY